MNRRRFSVALLRAGTVLSGLALPASSAFARSTGNGLATKAARTSTGDATGDEILQHVVASWQRSYECDNPATSITVIAVEFDTKRNAADAFDYLSERAVESFESFTPEEEGEYGDLADQGYIFSGKTTVGQHEFNIILLSVQQGTLVYAIVSAGKEDQVQVVGDYYETLFDETREETDIMLSEDEMPRGFVITEDSSGPLTGDESTPEPTEEAKPKKKRR